MALFLVQHGKTAESDDPERGLSDEGRADVTRIGTVAKGYGVAPARIFHGGKPRAKETAKLLAELLAPAGGVVARQGLAPGDDPGALRAYLDPAENLMLVGHVPFLEQLTGLLVTGTAERRVVRFQPGGIVCLDREPERRSWFVKWMLQPHID
ncbi:MAG: phosphohistidine phosphatase SixA [Polyangiaceae bacterium]|nr:phosphohistidine phosphatase SixA [Polyangiaceae bacterium]